MVQRTIINDISPDFRRDNQTQAQYLNKKSGQIIDFVARYIRKSGARGIVLGVSGGIDSFLVGALCAEACKREGAGLRLIILPKGRQADIADARESVRKIREIYPAAEDETVPIDDAYNGAVAGLTGRNGFAPDVYTLGNLQPRIRMMYQYALAGGMLVAGTDHPAEAVTGFYTKYGDGGTDINPIQELVKDDIYEMAAMYGAPEALMEKRPAAGLGISADDEAELGISYGDLCAYLRGRPVGLDARDKIEAAYFRSTHKRAMPASLKDEYNITEPFTFLLVDFVGSFLDGPLKCERGWEALERTIRHINLHPEGNVLYARDCHPAGHCSFEENGGIWPAHAVSGTKGVEFPDALYNEIVKTSNTPLADYNVFQKGMRREHEQYSAYEADNGVFGCLGRQLTSNVLVAGMATEYCVLQTVKTLLENGHHVHVLRDCLGYVSAHGHEKALRQMERAGAQIS
jgi:NAD+ synthetase